jgi:heat shock protein HslJ
MSCLGEANTVENEFSAALRQTAKREIFERRLTLMDEMGTRLAVLKKDTAPARR